MSLEVKEITDSLAWNAWVDRLNPNTFLHSWEWGQVQQKTGEGVRYLSIWSGNRQVGAALLILVKAKRGYFYLCPHGPLLSDESLLPKVLETLIVYLKQRAAAEQSVALKIAPLVLNTADNRQIFQTAGFRSAPLHIHTELTWARDIEANEESILADMRKTTRHAIKKAQKEGYVTEVIEAQDAVVHILDRFMPLYSTTTTRHGFVPFSRDFLDKQLTAFSHKMFMVIASKDEEDMAAALLVHTGNTIFYHHGASQKISGGSSAAQLVQWTAMQEGKRRGAIRYNFWGIAPDNQPNHPFAGITVFKKGFGGYALDYLHAQDLPLSWKYWQLWVVDMYRKYQRGF